MDDICESNCYSGIYDNDLDGGKYLGEGVVQPIDRSDVCDGEYSGLSSFYTEGNEHGDTMMKF